MYKRKEEKRVNVLIVRTSFRGACRRVRPQKKEAAPNSANVRRGSQDTRFPLRPNMLKALDVNSGASEALRAKSNLQSTMC